MAVEYVGAEVALLGVAVLLIWISFRLERKLESTSIIDFFDAIRFLFFATGLWLALLGLNLGQAIVANDTSDMNALFDTAIITFTGFSLLLICLGLAYFFIIIPYSLKKMRIERRRTEEEDNNPIRYNG